MGLFNSKELLALQEQLTNLTSQLQAVIIERDAQGVTLGQLQTQLAGLEGGVSAETHAAIVAQLATFEGGFTAAAHNAAIGEKVAEITRLQQELTSVKEGMEAEIAKQVTARIASAGGNPIKRDVKAVDIAPPAKPGANARQRHAAQINATLAAKTVTT